MTEWLDRRFILKAAGVTAMASVLAGPGVVSLAMARTRSLSFLHLHTGERLSVTYWADGAYLAEELSAIDCLLRDFRSGDVKTIDPRLLDRSNSVSPVLSHRRFPPIVLSMCQKSPRLMSPAVLIRPMAFSFLPRDARCGIYTDPPSHRDQADQRRCLACR